MKKVKLFLFTTLLAGFIPLKAETWSVYFLEETMGANSGFSIYAYVWDNIGGQELLGESPDTLMTVDNLDKLI